MEHILCNHNLGHLEKHNIFTILWHGFRIGYSCETQLIATLQDLMKYRGKQIQVNMGILDLFNMSDIVPHSRLLSRLKH